MDSWFPYRNYCMIKKIKIDGADMEFNIVKSGVQLCFTPTEFHKAKWEIIMVEKDDEGVYHITKLDECNDLAGANKSFESFRAKHWFETNPPSSSSVASVPQITTTDGGSHPDHMPEFKMGPACGVKK